FHRPGAPARDRDEIASSVHQPESPFGPRPSSGRSRWLSGLGMAAAVCAAYLAGRSSRPSVVRETSAARVLYYVDPMHPAYRSDSPGKAPDCGMDLVP